MPPATGAPFLVTSTVVAAPTPVKLTVILLAAQTTWAAADGVDGVHPDWSGSMAITKESSVSALGAVELVPARLVQLPFG